MFRKSRPKRCAVLLSAGWRSRDRRVSDKHRDPGNIGRNLLPLGVYRIASRQIEVLRSEMRHVSAHREKYLSDTICVWAASQKMRSNRSQVCFRLSSLVGRSHSWISSRVHPPSPRSPAVWSTLFLRFLAHLPGGLNKCLLMVCQWLCCETDLKYCSENLEISMKLGDWDWCLLVTCH